MNESEAKVVGAEAVLTALFESHTDGGHSLGRVCARFCELAGIERLAVPGLYQRLHEAGGLTVNNALMPDDDGGRRGPA